jgi:hypothetical protein
LAYALDKKSPFAALDEKVYDLDGFKAFFAKRITDKDLVSEMTTPNSAIITEADFWLKNYQNTSYLDVVISYFRENIDYMNKKVCTKLCDYLIYVRLDIDDYWDNVKPLVDKALRSIAPSHKMIKRSKKEEKIFNVLKRPRLEELEEEKEKRIAEVKSDIEKQVKTRKAEARKNYYGANGRNTGYLGGIIGAGTIVAVYGAILAKGVIGAILGAFVCWFVFGLIPEEIGRSNAANKVTITSAEEKDRDKRIENIEKDIQNKIAHLDYKIGGEILKKTDEEIDKMSGTIA